MQCQSENISRSEENAESLMDVDLSSFLEDDPFDECSSSKKLKVSDVPRGASLFDIYNGNTPWSAPEFPAVSPSENHTVLYQMSEKSLKGSTVPPDPRRGHDKWDKDHVRMPCSPQSLYPVLDPDGKSVLKNRWKMIEEALTKPIKNCKDLHAAILKYNSKFSKQWKFTALYRLFNEYLEEEESEIFFESTLPEMIKLTLRLPELVPGAIPLLKQNQNRSISISQQQAACLLANAFFCTFPRRNSNKPNAEYSNYPHINFCRLFQQSGSDSVLEKLKCICNYFRRVCRNVPCGNLTFSRRSIERSKMPHWKTSEKYLGSVPLRTDSKGTIEDDGLGLLQVDFANKFLGGGVLNYGCVQEEIRFVICPELLLSMLFTEAMKSGEALLMIGAERFNNYTGYSDSFQWSGNHEDQTEFDFSNRRRCAVVAIDALYFYRQNDQYKPELIDRELNKAWVGFSFNLNHKPGELTLPAVATGNWGCGAFRGSPHLKSLIQLMACCECQRPMLYFSFNDTSLQDDIIKMYTFLRSKNISIRQLYKYLCLFHTKRGTDDQLYPFILQQHKDEENLLKVKQQQKTEIRSQTPSSSNAILDSSLIATMLDDSSMKLKDSELENETVSSETTKINSNASFFDTIAAESSNTSNIKLSKNMSYFESQSGEIPTRSANDSPVSEELSVKSESSFRSKFSTGKITSYFQRTKKD